jgi:hypothetical protein
MDVRRFVDVVRRRSRAARPSPPDGAAALDYASALVRIVAGRSPDPDERALAGRTYRRVRQSPPGQFVLPLERDPGLLAGVLHVEGRFPRHRAPAGTVRISVVDSAVHVDVSPVGGALPGLGSVTVERADAADAPGLRSELLTALVWAVFLGTAPVPLPDLAAAFVAQPSFSVEQSLALAELAGSSRADRSGQAPELLRRAALDLGLVPDLDARGRHVLVAHLMDLFITGSVSAEDLAVLARRASPTTDADVDDLLEVIAHHHFLWGDEYVGDASVVDGITRAAADIRARM